VRILHFIQSGVHGGGIETYLQHLLATPSSDLEHEVVVASGEGYVLSQSLPVHQINWSAESNGGAEDGRRAMELIVARDGVPLFHDVPGEATLNACRARGLPVAILCHGHQWWCGSATRFHSRTGKTCEIRATTPRCLVRYHALRCGGRRLGPAVREIRRASTGRRALREAARTLVASRYMAEQAEMHGAPRLRVRQLPLPTPFAGAGPLPRADDPPIVLYPSRLTSLKGIEPTLEAFARIRADARLVVAGTGILAGRVAAAVAAHPARDRILLAGHLTLDGLREAFGRATVVVMPVLWPEPFGLVGIEALALGRPVVATDTGGVGEWAHEDLGVLRIARPTPSLLAEAIERVLTDPSWGMRARERGAPWVDERHSMKAHVESLRAALDPLRPPPRA
jgi:glycosyltransferase involved in cell wall biosynthesis